MEEKSGLNRRAWLKRFVAGGLLSPPAAYAYGRGWERHRPVVERVEIHLAGIGPAFDGFRIVHISDLHVEPNVDLPLLAQTVEIINGLKPDLVAITGDFITHDA